MGTTATIIRDVLQRDGYRHVTIKFIFDRGPDYIWEWRIPPSENAQDYANSIITKVENTLKRKEARDILSFAEKGKKNPDTEQLKYIRRNDIRRETLKRLFNLMRSDIVDMDKLYKIRNLYQYTIGYSNEQIGNFVGWDTARVSAARTKIEGLISSIDNLDHGYEEL